MKEVLYEKDLVCLQCGFDNDESERKCVHYYNEKMKELLGDRYGRKMRDMQ